MASKRVAILWQGGPLGGTLRVTHGRLGAVTLVTGTGTVEGGAFSISSAGPSRLEVEVREARLEAGANATLVAIETPEKAFSFFLRDVRTETPVFIPGYGVAVTEGGDGRSYADIQGAVEKRGLRSSLGQIASEPEETYEHAAARTRSMVVPTWLGLGRDMRIFEVVRDDSLGCGLRLRPRFHGDAVRIPETGACEVEYGFTMGRGCACVDDVRRGLEDGCLPILRHTVVDEDVAYALTAFVSLEQNVLTAANVRGTDFLVAHGHSMGYSFCDEQPKRYEARREAEEVREQETVLYARVEAVNNAAVPRYAWLKCPWPLSRPPETGIGFDGETGWGSFTESGRVFCISRLGGAPMPQSEAAVLLQPGAAAVFEFFLPHQPLSGERAAALAGADFDARHAECREFWRAKLARGGRISVPETVVDEMVSAGLLHLDLVAYGREPEGAVTPSVGVYSAIGSESAPIIQFFDSLGWHDVARRAIGSFLERQRADGFIQSFDEYMLETGPVVWTMGEHYRYTRDDAWVRQVRDKVVKACEHMLAWRERNKRDELRGRGYGLQQGKVGDPPDPYHTFMLNGYAYLGMKRAGEMLERVDAQESRRWSAEAAAFKDDIRTAFFDAMARSPVVPLGDGTWVPTAPPWAEGTGPMVLYVEPGEWFTHGTFTARDGLIGPVYLVLQEVLDAGERAAAFMLRWQCELMCVRNVGLSQPYYCRHDYAHLKRGEVKAFLKTYYNGFTGLADRETYTWWEHYFHASPHKTHEEAWFLMQTRWMLWMEDGDTLRLLPGVPRAWLEDGKRIELRNVATYFGPVSLAVESRVGEGVIEAAVQCRSDRQPKSVALRLPHPDGRRAEGVDGGRYVGDSEVVVIDGFRDAATVRVRF